jgi:hypothetical protein
MRCTANYREGRKPAEKKAVISTFIRRFNLRTAENL